MYNMCISEKLNSVQRMNVCPLAKVDYLITDLDPDSPVLDDYREKGIQLY